MENRKEKVIINSEDVCSLEEVLGPNDSLFQSESESQENNE